MHYRTCRYNVNEKYNKISSKIYKHIVQQKVKQKVQQKMQQKVDNNHVALLIKRFALTKLVEFLY